MGVRGRWAYHTDIGRSTKRWRDLRAVVLRRDGYACRQCGARGCRLEVDHVEPARSAPERYFDAGNLQTLCRACHSRKTRVEVGHPELSPSRRAWRDAVAALVTSRKHGVTNA